MIFFLAKKTLRSYFVEFLLLEGCLIIFFSIPAGNFSCLPDFLTILDISFTIASRQSWARLIQKIYEVDPLVCTKCSHKMRIVAVITDPDECKHSLVVSKILGYLKRNNAPFFNKVVTKVS